MKKGKWLILSVMTFCGVIFNIDVSQLTSKQGSDLSLLSIGSTANAQGENGMGGGWHVYVYNGGGGSFYCWRGGPNYCLF